MALLKYFPVGPLDVNCYLFGDEETRQCAIIDPGGDEHRIKAALQEHNLIPRMILLTHAHFDHAGAVAALKEQLGLRVGVGEAEQAYLENLQMNGALWMGFPFTPTDADFVVREGDEFPFGQSLLRAIETPGHSPAGITYVSDGVAIVGDVLFRRGVGRHDLPGADGERLARSLEKLLALPDETQVFPGHGEPTTIGEERRANPFFAALGVAQD